MHGSDELKKLGGLYRAFPALAAMFFVSALAWRDCRRFPDFGQAVVDTRPGCRTGQYAIVGVSLAVSALTLFSMTKIWAEVFWKPSPADAAPAHRLPRRQLAVLLAPVAVLALGVPSAWACLPSRCLCCSCAPPSKLLDPQRLHQQRACRLGGL